MARAARPGQGGQVLVVVIAVAAVATLAMAAFGMLVSNNTRATRLQNSETQARYIAEAAAQRVVGHLQGQSQWNNASLPSPNPMTFSSATNQARVSYVSQSRTKVVVKSEGYLLASGYSLPASATPTASKVVEQAAIQATIQKIRGSSIWAYAAYADSSQTYNAVTHGSLYIGSGNFTMGSGTAIQNDFSYVSAQTPTWLQAFLNGQNQESLYASLRVENGNVTVSGTGQVGSATYPLNSVALKSGKTINVGSYYNKLSTVVKPGTFPTISNADMTVFRTTGGSLTDVNNGCVWDNDALSNGSKSLSLTLGGDVPNCTIGSNGITWQPASNLLTVNGTVFVDGDLTIGDSTYDDIQYTGVGMIVVNGNVTINGGIRPLNIDSFPDSALIELLSKNALTIGATTATPYKVVAAALFANTNVTINKNTIVFGALAAGGTVTTTATPVLYQYPTLSSSLMTGTPDNTSTGFSVLITDWRRTDQ